MVVDSQKQVPSNSMSEILTRYKFQTTGEQELARKDMQTLRPGIWLNDEIVNYAIGLMQERELRLLSLQKDDKKTPRVHFFGSFFYAKLFANKREYDYPSVKRWTTLKKLGGYSVLDCDLIIVPVNLVSHSYLK
jgi:sentrin-specific protease 1